MFETLAEKVQLRDLYIDVKVKKPEGSGRRDIAQPACETPAPRSALVPSAS
jgi:hypothetical protein